MKHFFALCALVLAHAAPGQFAEIRTYGGAENDVANALLEHPDGGYLLAGTTASALDGLTSVYLLRVDEALEFVWSIPMGAGSVEHGRDLALGTDIIWVAGFTNDSPGGDYDGAIFATTLEGALLWETTYGGTDWDFLEAIATHPDGGYVACGKTYDGAGGSDVWIIRCEADGNLMWNQHYGGVADEWAEAIVVDTDGSVVVGGNLTHPTNAALTRPWILRVDGGDGTLIADNSPDAPDNATLLDLLIHPGGFAYVGHWSEEGVTDQTEYLHAKVDDDLNALWWHENIINPGINEIRAMANFPPGFVIAAVADQIGNPLTNVVGHRRFSDGIYANGYHWGEEGDEDPNDIILDAQGRPVICGRSNSYNASPDFDALLIRLDSPDMIPPYELDEATYDDVSLNVSSAGLPTDIALAVVPGGVSVDVLEGKDWILSRFSLTGQRLAEHSGTGDETVLMNSVQGVQILRLESNGAAVILRLVR